MNICKGGVETKVWKLLAYIDFQKLHLTTVQTPEPKRYFCLPLPPKYIFYYDSTAMYALFRGGPNTNFQTGQDGKNTSSKISGYLMSLLWCMGLHLRFYTAVLLHLDFKFRREHAIRASAS